MMSGTCSSANVNSVEGLPSRHAIKRKVKSNVKTNKYTKEQETELLTRLFYSGSEEDLYDDYTSEYVEQEDDDLILTDDELVDQYPCQLDFVNLKQGRITRKPNRKTGMKKINASCLKSMKTNHVNADINVSISFYKKVKHARVCIIKRQVRKALERMRVAELKTAKNWDVELCHQVNQSPEKNSSTIRPSNTRHTNDYHHNKNHVLRGDNGDKFASETLLSGLIAIQEREITPEDFDLLLQLDTFVEVKTVPKSVIDSLRTEVIDHTKDICCMICMQDYELGQVTKYLKCNHFFHSNCIRTWLNANSTKCPLDGLEVC